MAAFDLETSLDRARREPDTRRAGILRAAEAQFAAEGYDRVTVRNIADAAGANVATLHLHWKNKATLYEAVCRLHARLLLQLVEEVAAEGGDRPLGELVERLVGGIADLFVRHPAIAPLALESFSGQAPPTLTTLLEHDLRAFGFVEAEIRARVPSTATDLEPILILLAGLYFIATLFCDSPLQRALLGGSVYEDSTVRERAVKFADGALRAWLGENG